MHKKKYLLVLLLWPIIAIAISFLLKVNAIISIALFLLLPSIYLSILIPRLIKKAALFSLFTAVPAIIFVDYIAHLNNQWLVPFTIFPFKLFGLVPFEDVLWAFFNVYFVILFYEYFMESHRKDSAWHPRMNILAGIFVGLLVLFILSFYFFPSILQFPYAYLWMGIIVVLIPTIIELFRRPSLLPKLLVVALYFAYVTICYELTALKLGWWLFPGSDYIGTVTVFGLIFPFEEFFFWVLLFAVGILAYYEPFDDDEK